VEGQDAQLDQAVKDGLLTRKQADAVKAARKKSGSVLGGPRFHGDRACTAVRASAADPADPAAPVRAASAPDTGCWATSRPGSAPRSPSCASSCAPAKSVAEIAKANGKSFDDVRAAVKAAAKTRLDKAVKDGDLTQKQADAMAEHLDEAQNQIESGKRLMGRRHRHLRGEMPPAGQLRPGG